MRLFFAQNLRTILASAIEKTQIFR